EAGERDGLPLARAAAAFGGAERGRDLPPPIARLIVDAERLAAGDARRDGPPDLAGAAFGEPDVAIRSGHDAVGKGAGGRQRELGHRAREGDRADGVALALHEPEIVARPAGNAAGG